ncbi:MAG: lysophospholipid acyltransferase family protein [Rhodomicrobium sp.]
MKIERLLASVICGMARLVTGVRAVWRGNNPGERQRIYFSNHRSHGDFLVIWASLPPAQRWLTRPVAAADYWLSNPVRRYFIDKVFRGVPVSRNFRTFPPPPNPVEAMGEALTAGESLIMFPEGTRNTGDDLLPFKPGIYHLARAHPQAELVPVWIENLGRVLPKGEFVPVPLLCSLTFGPPVCLAPEEGKEAFLARARAVLIALAPQAA